MRRNGLFLMLLIAAALIVAGCGENVAQGQEEEGDFTVQGIIETKEVDLNSKIPGRIEKLHVEEGDEVEAGELLVKISSEELEAKRSQAEALVEAAKGKLEAALAAKEAAMAQLNKAESGARKEKIAQAKAAYELMQKTYERVKNLHAKDAVSDQKLDEVETQLEVAKQKYEMAVTGARTEDKSTARAMVLQANAMVEAARGKLEQARAGLAEVQSYLKDTELKAPISGTVTSVTVEEGELVSTGMPVLTVTDLSRPWVEVNVRETQLGSIRLGQEVRVEVLSYGDTEFKGKVVRIDKKADFATKRATNDNGDFDIVSFGVKVELIDPGKPLLPGMTAIVHFPHRN